MRLVNVQLQPPAWQLFLLSAYQNYPPPDLSAQEVADEIRHVSACTTAMTAVVARALRKALKVYHPDKNLAAVRGERWAEDAGRITRMATSLLDHYRRRVQPLV